MRARRATADRCVYDVDILRTPGLCQFNGGGIADGGVNRDDGAGLGPRSHRADHLTHLRVVEHCHADQVGLGDIGKVVRRTRSCLDERRHGLGP